LFKPAGHKELIVESLQSLYKNFPLELAAWVILDNHYHALIKTRAGEALPRFFARLHGSTSFELNKRDNEQGRQVWQTYWDTGIRNDEDYWTRFNYIHHNPVKHGCVKQMYKWPYSSYAYYQEDKGGAWLMDAFSKYPIIDFQIRVTSSRNVNFRQGQAYAEPSIGKG
jgi:putative transposase